MYVNASYDRETIIIELNVDLHTTREIIWTWPMLVNQAEFPLINVWP
jgi:hypothetical protein